MNLFLFLLSLFFIIVILFPFLKFNPWNPFSSNFKREGLTPLDNENNNNIIPISLTDLEKKVQDLSGNLMDLQNTVDQLVVSQADYLSKNPLPEADISLSSVS